MKVIVSSIVVLFASIAMANAPAHGTAATTGTGKPAAGAATAGTGTAAAAPGETAGTTGVGKPATGTMAGKTAKVTKAECDKMTDATAKTECEAKLKTHK